MPIGRQWSVYGKAVTCSYRGNTENSFYSWKLHFCSKLVRAKNRNFYSWSGSNSHTITSDNNISGGNRLLGQISLKVTDCGRGNVANPGTYQHSVAQRGGQGGNLPQGLGLKGA